MTDLFPNAPKEYQFTGEQLIHEAPVSDLDKLEAVARAVADVSHPYPSTALERFREECPPSVVLDLIERVRKAEAENETLHRDVVDKATAFDMCVARSARAEAAEAEAAKLRAVVEAARKAEQRAISHWQPSEINRDPGDVPHWHCAECDQFWETQRHETGAHAEGCSIAALSAALSALDKESGHE